MRNSEFFTIQFKHIPTGRKTSFEGWVTTFSDNFSSQWNEVPVYGRMDPLATFTRTSRKIQLAFDVVSDNLGGANKNLQQVNDLITFLYPVYEKQGGTGNQRVGHTLKAAPLIELKWTNLIADASDNSGLIGYLDGVNYAPKMDDGGFGRAAGYMEGLDRATAEQRTQAQGAEDKFLTRAARREVTARTQPQPPPGRTSTDINQGVDHKTDIYIPKTLSISLNFTVLHKHLPGWTFAQGTNEIIFGNKQVNGSFPNLQEGRSTGASQQITTTTITNDDGETEITNEVTQITTAAAAAVLQGASTDTL